MTDATRSVSPTCELWYGRGPDTACGQPTTHWYPLMGGGTMALCRKHAEAHLAYATPYEPPAVPERLVLVSKIAAELDRAYAKHGRQPWGRHEFYAILLEEVEELWDAIKRDESRDRVLEELVQVAAVCFRHFETREAARA